jgi:hypothetical protein
MKIKDVPQDNSPTFEGHGTKAIYAVDENGRYIKTATNGWDVEEVVLRDVLADFEIKTALAQERVLRDETSPIEYFLNKRLMDLPALAQAMGMFQWRVRRHLKPKVFRKLNESLLKRYADLFRIDVSTLKRFKEIITHDPDTQF